MDTLREIPGPVGAARGAARSARRRASGRRGDRPPASAVRRHHADQGGVRSGAGADAHRRGGAALQLPRRRHQPRRVRRRRAASRTTTGRRWTTRRRASRGCRSGRPGCRLARGWPPPSVPADPRVTLLLAIAPAVDHYDYAGLRSSTKPTFVIHGEADEVASDPPRAPALWRDGRAEGAGGDRGRGSRLRRPDVARRRGDRGLVGRFRRTARRHEGHEACSDNSEHEVLMFYVPIVVGFVFLSCRGRYAGRSDRFRRPHRRREGARAAG